MKSYDLHTICDMQVPPTVPPRVKGKGGTTACVTIDKPVPPIDSSTDPVLQLSSSNRPVLQKEDAIDLEEGK